MLCNRLELRLRLDGLPMATLWRPVCNAIQAPNKREAHVLGIMRPSVVSPFDQQLKLAKNPMLLEAGLVIQHKSMPIELPSPVTPLHSTDWTQTPKQQEDHTPLMIRSNVEQLVGQQLIKVLSNFKHNVVYPLSPPFYKIHHPRGKQMLEIKRTHNVAVQR
jgi:hypothetical protein